MIKLPVKEPSIRHSTVISTHFPTKYDVTPVSYCYFKTR